MSFFALFASLAVRSLFFNRPFATLAQEREGREGRRKGIFLALRAIKHVFLRVLGVLGGSFFIF